VNIERVLSVLEKVQPRGKDKWLACCPAHDDRSPSLSIAVKDNTVVVHCFSGCGGTEVAQALVDKGCEWDDLFPEKVENRPSFFPKPASYYSKHELEELELQAWFLSIFATSLHRNEKVSDKDMSKARACYKSLKSEYENIKESKHKKLFNKIHTSINMMDCWREVA